MGRNVWYRRNRLLWLRSFFSFLIRGRRVSPGVRFRVLTYFAAFFRRLLLGRKIAPILVIGDESVVFVEFFVSPFAVVPCGSTLLTNRPRSSSLSHISSSFSWNSLRFIVSYKLPDFIYKITVIMPYTERFRISIPIPSGRYANPIVPSLISLSIFPKSISSFALNHTSVPRWYWNLTNCPFQSLILRNPEW